MNEDRFVNLLREADRPPARGAPIEPGTIRMRAIRHRRRRRVLQGGLLLLLAAGIAAPLSGLWRRAIPSRIEATNQTGGAKPIVAQSEEVTVAQKIALESQIRLDHRMLVTRAHTVDGIDLAAERSAAARTMVEVAQRRSEIAGRQEAAELYQRTIALFPETPSAVTARVALTQFEQDN